MKVAKLAHEVSDYDPVSVKKSFVIVEHEPTVTTDDVKPKVTGPQPEPEFGVWLPAFQMKDPLTIADKQRYEWFCAGFLAYYDQEVRNNAVDHTIFFKWEDSNRKVSILMSPKPLHALNSKGPSDGTTDPPRPPSPPPPPMGKVVGNK